MYIEGVACETRVRPDSCKIKESECTASDQPFRWRCVLPLNSRWHNKHSWNLWRGKRLVTLEQISNKSPRGVAVFQNKFVIIYIVELSKPYRMVFESVQAKQIVPLFTRVYCFRVCETHAAKQLPRSSWTSPGYILLNSKRVLSVSLC